MPSDAEIPGQNGAEQPVESEETPQAPDVRARQDAARQQAYYALRQRMAARQAAHNPTIAFILRRKMRRPKADGR